MTRLGMKNTKNNFSHPLVPLKHRLSEHLLYKITNQETGECYIGQTKKDLARRIYDHEYEAFNRKATDKFHSALRAWGRRAFNWSIVDECNNYTKLSKLEKKYIKRYDAIDNGYNTQIRFDANAINRINKTNYVNNFLKRVQ